LDIELGHSCKDFYVFVEVAGRLSDAGETSELYGQRKGILSTDAVLFKKSHGVGQVVWLRPKQWKKRSSKSVHQ
jgi:hypothetical protein